MMNISFMNGIPDSCGRSLPPVIQAKDHGAFLRIHMNIWDSKKMNLHRDSRICIIHSIVGGAGPSGCDAKQHIENGGPAVGAILPFVDIVCTGRVSQPGCLPEYLGITLRGALGFSLKQTVCHINHRNCDICVLRERCPFPAIFDGVPPADRTFMRKYSHVPQPFVIKTERIDVDSISHLQTWTVRLFGPYADLYPYVVAAIERMCVTGLGRDRTPVELLQLTDGHNTIYQPGDTQIQRPTIREGWPDWSPPSQPGTLEMHLHSPLNLRIAGRDTEQPTLADLTRAAVRRLRILMAFYGDQSIELPDPSCAIADAEAAEPAGHETQWWQARRYSNRQKRSMNIGGLVGTFRFRLKGTAMLPWFSAMQICSLGKHTSFGFGNISCEVLT